MNLSPSALLVVIVATVVANILILMAVVMKSRAERARRYADVQGYLSSSYSDHGSADQAPESRDASAASSDRWPTVRGWPTADDGWPPPVGVGATGVAPADAVAAPDAEPFEYPTPTSLEQRSLDLEDQVEDSESADVEGQHDAADTIAANDTDADADEHESEAHDVDEANTDGGPAAAEVTAIPRAHSISVARGRDALTGLLDAMAFEEALAHEDAREQRYGRPATVVVFELDGLAKLVERLGSDPGDRIETALGDAIQRLARRADYVARLERGRYGVLLPETDEIAAINYVERIRRACDLWLESSAIAMRLAIGWASTTGDATLAGAIRLATERMRVEQRRNARGVGDEATGLDALDDVDALEDAAGL